MNKESTPPLKVRVEPRLMVSLEHDSPPPSPISPVCPRISESREIGMVSFDAPRTRKIHIRAPKTLSEAALVRGTTTSAPDWGGKSTYIRIGLLALLFGVFLPAGFLAYLSYFPMSPAPRLVPPEPAIPPNFEKLSFIAPSNTGHGNRALGGPDPQRLLGLPASTARKELTKVAEVSFASETTMWVPHAISSTTASAAFRSFVAGAKIGGVRANAMPPTAIINNNLVRLGHPVDNGLGLTITITAANSDKHELTFVDGSGASVVRRY